MGFGDGITVEPVNPNSSVTHTYTEDGTYIVSVKAELNLEGTQTDAIEITVGSGTSTDVGDINLIVSSFAIDREVTPGGLETVSAIIQNIGTDILEGVGLIHIGYYLSTDDKITVDDIYIGDTSIILGPETEEESKIQFESLSPGEIHEYNHQLAVKGNIPGGTYYAGAIVDYIDYFKWYSFPRSTDTLEYLFPDHIVIPESNENDNDRLLPAHQVLVIGAACAEDVYEEDDKSSKATLISVGDTQVHNFCTDNSDWLKFDATKGSVYKFSTDGLEAETDTQLILYDMDASFIILFDDNLGNTAEEKHTVDLESGWPPDPRSEIVWEAEATGTYFIKVRTTACDEDQDDHCAESPDGVGNDTGYTIILQ